ncbi:MAG: HAD family hydrolase [Acidobacteria bacterium]|nr:HAD family hydrolase [Acidobacteriota bacterium]
MPDRSSVYDRHYARAGPRAGKEESVTPAVFLDRDGTLIDDVGYLDRVERLRVYPYSIECVRLLNRAGYAVVVITNQAGVARGFFKEEFLAEVHGEITSRFHAGGARIDAFYYCPHHPDAPIEAYRRHCDCRKPMPGLVLKAADHLSLDLARSVVVGDRWLDVRLAHAVGAGAVLVRTGYGRSEETNAPPDVQADHVGENLIEAVSWILKTPATHG